MEDLEVLELETMERMDKALEKLSENLMTVRTEGQAKPCWTVSWWTTMGRHAN